MDTSQRKVLSMYSEYAQMGRHPHKLHLQTPDALSLPASGRDTQGRWPRYEVAVYSQCKEKSLSFSEFMLEASVAASRWLSSGESCQFVRP